MLSAIALALLLPAESFRLAQNAMSKNEDTTCACSDTGVVDGVNTNKPGCAQHFGQRFGYICYISDGATCEGARLSSRTGVYWRGCRQEHLTEEAQQFVEDAMNDLDPGALETTISVARTRGVSAEFLATAEARVLQQREMITARDELMEALEAFDAGRLRAALEAAEELELDEFLSDDVMERSVERFEFLQSREDAESALRAAVEDTNLADLQTKLQTAGEFHVSPEAIRLGQNRIAELTRLMAAAVTELDAAMLTRNAARISDARSNSLRLHAIDDSTSHSVDARLVHLTTMERATEELRPAIEGLSLRNLQAKLQRAQELDAYPDVLSQGEARVAELTQMNADALQALTDATAGHHASRLLHAIEQAQTLDTSTNHPEAMAAARTRLDALGRKDVARAMLEEAVGTVNLEDIQEKLDNAADLGVDATVLDTARQRISEITQMRVDARSALESAIAGNELMVLDDALAEAQRLSVADGDITDRANERLAVLTRRQDAKDELMAAIAGTDRDALEAKIAEGRELGVDEATLHQGAVRSREILSLMHRVERHLHRDIQGDDFEQLRDSMAEAQSYNGAVTAEQLDAARARLAELETIYNAERDLRNAHDSTSMGHIQHMLQNCRAVSCHTAAINDGEAAADVLRRRMGHAEGALRWLIENGDNCAQAQELTDILAEVRLLNAASLSRLAAGDAKLPELQALC
jgi:hypothetical protein